MLAFGVDAGDFEGADGDDLVTAPGLGRVDGRVAVRGDLDLVIEPNRLGRKAFVEFVGSRSRRPWLFATSGGQNVLAGGGLQVVAHESGAAVGGNPAERVQAVIRDGP